MYNRHAASKDQMERRPMNSYEFPGTAPHDIIHIDSRHARTYTTGTHKHAESMGRTRQFGWARLGGFNVNHQASFNNPYIFLAGKRISNSKLNDNQKDNQKDTQGTDAPNQDNRASADHRQPGEHHRDSRHSHGGSRA